MTTPTDNPTDEQPDLELDNLFDRAKANPELLSRLFKLINAIDSLADAEGKATAEMLAAKLLNRDEKVRNSDKEKIPAIEAEQEEKSRIGRIDETRRRAWSIMGTLIWSGIIDCPDVDITARTVDNLEDLKACRNVLENVQFIIGHIELALAQVLI